MPNDCDSGACNTQTLTLNPSGNDGCTPDPDPWCPANGSQVEIKNQSGANQRLWDITPGLLNPAPGGEINIAAGATWTGTVGNNKGCYTYNDGIPNAGPRNGTIDPS